GGASLQGPAPGAAKGRRRSLLLRSQPRPPGLPRPQSPGIGNSALPPLRHRLRIDPVAPGQNPQAFLTILYCSTNRRCRAGATVENLAHSESFHCWPNNAPSNPGTKHLERGGRAVRPPNSAKGRVIVRPFVVSKLLPGRAGDA